MPANYKIPQNVELEDKIFGPLTLKQFLFALGAGLATFVDFNAFYTISAPFFFVTAFFIWVVAAAFIFVRPNDQPFSRFFFAFLWFTMKPNRRVWKRIHSLDEVMLEDPKPLQAEETSQRLTSEEAKSRLQSLAHLVDTRGWGDADDDAELTGRVTSGKAKPRLNIVMSDSDRPEDILAAEDGDSGTARASAELDRVLRSGVAKPSLDQRAAR